MYYEDLSFSFASLLRELEGTKVAVLGHARPDGDCIGSQIALSRVLRASGMDAVCVNEDVVPRRLAFVVDAGEVLRARDYSPDGRLAITVDCADPTRIGDRLQTLFPKIFANIDHHVSNTRYGENNLVDSNSSATAEILAGMFMDNSLPVDSVTAQGLYVGIATDTGQFRFPSTSPRVFDICSRLLRSGADPVIAFEEIYGSETMGKMRLLEAYLSTLHTECGGRVCIGTLKEGIFEKTGSGPEDTEGLVDYARAIKGVDVAVLLEESADGVKGSLRAKDPAYRVDRVAADFEGGGHACAAGFSAPMPLDELYPKLIARLSKCFNDTMAPEEKNKE
ncbi:MAG: bifunctional oligoribonuclease/PAP phosphatase NrnA [Opitutales bacterium]